MNEHDPATTNLPGDGITVDLHVVRHSLGGRVLFEALDMSVAGGAVTCLLGPSGVGKSTLLRLLAGLAPPEPGDRFVCSDGGPLTGRVAYMDQRDLLLPWLDVLGNVTLGRRLRGEPRAIDRARRLIGQVGLAGREHDPPSALSGGMRQRAALARTLMEDRPIVLMDEPFSMLDALNRYRLQAMAAELLGGRTVLLVTHDPSEALRLGHRIHVMTGEPARLDQALSPPGPTPREPTDQSLVPFQRELMARLGMRTGGGS